MIPCRLSDMQRIYRYSNPFLSHLTRIKRSGESVLKSQMQRSLSQSGITISSQSNRRQYSSQLDHRHFASQSNGRHFPSQSNGRCFSNQSDYSNFSSQSDGRDYLEIDKRLASIDNRRKQKGGRGWTITRAVTQHIHEHLANDPKYTTTLDRPRDSFRISESELDIDIEQKIKRIDKLCENGNVSQATGVVVNTIMKYAKWPEEVLKPLERWLTHRVHILSLPDALYALDAFVQMEYQPRYLLKILLRHLALHFDSTDKTPANVVHLMFLIGLSRDAPVELMHDLETYIEENVHKFSSVEISIICFSFFVTNRAMRSSSLTQTMAETLLNEFRVSHQNRSRDYMNLYRLGSILKAFRHAGYREVAFYEELGDLICESAWGLAHDRPIKDINVSMQIAQTYATLGIKHEQLFQEMEGKIPALQTGVSGQGVRFRAKDLARLCWSYVILRRTVPKNWQDALIDELTAMPIAER